MITIQKNILALFFVSLLLPNRGYNFNYSNNYYLNKEMSSIENGEIGDANFIFPNIDKLSYSAKNIIDNKNFGLYPILEFDIAIPLLNYSRNIFSQICCG